MLETAGPGRGRGVWMKTIHSSNASIHTHKASLSSTTRHPYVLGGVGDDYDKKFNSKYPLIFS